MAQWANRPNNWGDVKPAEEGGVKLLPGVYPCIINNAWFVMSKKGQEMLVIEFDISGGDFAWFYKNRYKRFREKWGGTYYQFTGSENPNALSLAYFKGVITSLEESNGQKWNFTDDWFRGKKFAGVFGEEEYMLQGELKTACKLRYIRDLHKINELKVPPIKKLNGNAISSQYSRSNDYNAPTPNAFIPVDGGLDDEDLPF